MVCKEEVVLWFKELESYKRIDTMCTLLNMCLPFELRFLGSCLEELGRRDAHELRVIEQRVNNPSELATDISACQTGDPTDKKVRRKMALYLALMRGSNNPCVQDIYRILEGWGDRDFKNFDDGDPLQELLLVYTMATNHPVFSFEQRLKCGEIYVKIQDTKILDQQSSNIVDSHQQQTITIDQQQQHLDQQPQPKQFYQSSTTLPIQHDFSPTATILPLPVSQEITPIMTPSTPHGTLQLNYAHVQPTDTSVPPPSLSTDSISQILPTHGTIPVHPDINLINPNIPIWAIRQNNMVHPHFPPPQSIATIDLLSQAIAPQTASPMLSQSSSPVHSRTSSPVRGTSTFQPINRNQSSVIHQRSSSMVSNLSSRRPSIETPPPPPAQPVYQQSGFSNDVPLAHKLYDGIIVNFDGNLTQFNVSRNGMRPMHQAISRQTNKTYLHQFQQQHQTAPTNNNFVTQNNLNYTLQHLTLNDVNHIGDSSSLDLIRKTSGGNGGGGGTGSDSGSSMGSINDISPPETPVLITSNSNPRLKDSNYNYNKLTRHSSNSNSSKNSDKYNSSIGGISTKMFIPGTNLFSGDNTTTTMTPNNNNNNNINTSNIICSGNTQIPGTSISPQSSINVATNPMLMQQQQQSQLTIQTPPPPPLPVITQYNAFTYHQRPGAATLINNPVSIGSTTVGGNGGSITTGIPQPTVFRPHQTFQMQPNGEFLYPFSQVTPTAITFLPTSSGGSRTSPSAPALFIPVMTTPLSQTTNTTNLMSSLGGGNTIGGSSINSYIHSNKINTSCFNCGSHSHTGRDCTETSLEDATRNSIYKLDYSSINSGVGIGVGNSSNNSSNSNINNNSNIIGSVSSLNLLGIVPSTSMPSIPSVSPITIMSTIPTVTKTTSITVAKTSTATSTTLTSIIPIASTITSTISVLSNQSIPSVITSPLITSIPPAGLGGNVINNNTNTNNNTTLSFTLLDPFIDDNSTSAEATPSGVSTLSSGTSISSI